MNIRTAQLTGKLKEVEAELYAEGSIVDPREVAGRARNRIPTLGEPTISLLNLKKGQTLSGGIFTKFVGSMIFDLSILREVMRTFYAEHKERYLRNEALRFKALSDIADMDSRIDNMLGVVNGTYLDYINEPFIDTQNLLSGHSAVDLQFGNLQLPIKRTQTKRQQLILPEGFTPDVDISGPSISNILYAGQLIRTGFQNALTDSDKLWLYQTKVRDYTDNLTLSFVIPLNEFLSSEVALEPYSDSPIDINLELTKDGVNYYDVAQSFTNGQELQFRYESTILRAVRITCSGIKPGEIKAGIATYLMGFKTISILNKAYVSNCVVETKVRPCALGNVAKTVSLDCDEDLPDGTDISYYIRGEKAGGGFTDYNLISPINRPNKWSPTILEITGMSKRDEPIRDNEPVFIERYDEIDFYKVGSIPDGDNIDYSSLQLHRAINSWELRDRVRLVKNNVTTRLDLRKDRDVPIHFYLTETARFISDNAIGLNHRVDFNRAGQELIPRSKDAIDPDTAIVSVKRFSFQSPIGFGTNGTGAKYYKNNNLSFPTLIPAILNEVANPSARDKESLIEPPVAKAPGDIYGIDITPNEGLIIQYANGTTNTISFKLRSLIRLKGVTQPTAGSFKPTGSFNATGTTNLALVDDDGNEISLLGSEVINGVLTTVDIIGLSFNSHQATIMPANSGATSRGYYLLPNREHITQAPDLFKNNSVYDMPVPFPVKITTETFSGIYEVDRVSDYTINGETRPVLVISNTDKLGNTIPTAQVHKILAWEIIEQDITQEVVKLTDDKVYFNETMLIEPGDKIEVRYRVSTESPTIRVLPETLEIIDSTSGAIYVEGRDYIYKDGIIRATKEAIVWDIVAKFTYEERSNNLYELTTNLLSINDRVIDLQIENFDSTAFVPDDKAGEGIFYDGTTLTKGATFSVNKGWHKVTIIAKDLVRLLAFAKALDRTGKMLFTNNVAFSKMEGKSAALTYVPYDTLKHCTYKANPTNFSIVDGAVIVPFNPNNNAFIDNRVYNIYKGEDLKNAIGDYYIADFTKIPVVKESFNISYSYIKDIDGSLDDNLITGLQVKINLTRNNNASSSFTPVLKNLNIRIN